MSITRLHGNDRGILQGWDIFYQRITLFLRVRIGQDKEFIITHRSKECLQIGFEILADYYFLSGHNVLFIIIVATKVLYVIRLSKQGKENSMPMEQKLHRHGTKVSPA